MQEKPVQDGLKILIADDHDLVREGLKQSLSALADSLTVVEARNAREVLDAASTHGDLDLVLLDLFMPGAQDFSLLSTLCDDHPSLPVVVLSAADDPELMRGAIDRGAAGYIPKTSATGVMMSAVQLALSGGVYIPPAMVRQAQVTSSLSPPPRPDSTARPAPGLGVKSPLTGRQLDVLALLGAGKSNKVIARELGLSEHTVKIHITAILKALNVSNRTEAAIVARERGLIPRHDEPLTSG